MKTTNHNRISAVTLIAACFPFNGLSHDRKLQLRHQHFKRKQHG